jgi:hypothetical protein
MLAATVNAVTKWNVRFMLFLFRLATVHAAVSRGATRRLRITASPCPHVHGIFERQEPDRAAHIATYGGSSQSGEDRHENL